VGYYTQYTLMQLRNALPDDALALLIVGDECARYALMPDGDSRKPQKWYEHEESVCEWSTQYPKTVFCLHADGEDADGIWDKYFLGGKLVHTESFRGLPRIDLDSFSR